MVYFITLYCWLTLGATIVNIPYQKHTHNHSKIGWGQLFQTGAKTATNFRKTIKRLKMVYFTTLYCWLTLKATTVNIPYQKHTHNHSKPDGGSFSKRGRKPPQISEKL